MRDRRSGAVRLGVAVLLLSSCGVEDSSDPSASGPPTVCSSPTVHIQTDGPDFRSVTDFPPSKTVAVVATIGESVPIRAEDPAGSIAPYPLDAVKLEVERVVRGQVDPQIVVARTGGGGCAKDEDITPLVMGDQVLLFLVPSSVTWQGLAVYRSWDDQGVYDIDNGVVTQRTPPHRREPTDPPLPLAEAIRLIRNVGS